jgi:hypothetical protein
MIMSKSKNRTVIDKYDFYFRPLPLDYTNEYRYLGIIFDNKGKIRLSIESTFNLKSYIHTSDPHVRISEMSESYNFIHFSTDIKFE